MGVLELLIRLEDECGLQDIYRVGNKARMALVNKPSIKLDQLIKRHYDELLAYLPKEKQRRPGLDPGIVVVQIVF